MFYGNQKFRRDCTNNTASENKIDQILEEFEIVRQKQLQIARNEAQQTQLKQEEEIVQVKEESKNKDKPHDALNKIQKAMKIEIKVSKCLELLKTLFKDHILTLHPAHILQTVMDLTDAKINYRKQDDRKYLLVILNIIIDKKDHCILKEYGNFYKIIDTLRVNLLLFSDDSFQFQKNMKRFTSIFEKFVEEQQSTQQGEDENKIQVSLPQISGGPVPKENVTNEQKKQSELEERVSEQQSEPVQFQVEEKSKAQEIRERLFKKKQEKMKEKDEQKLNKLNESISQQVQKEGVAKEETSEKQIEIQELSNPSQEQQQEQQQQQVNVSKVEYTYDLSPELNEILINKEKQKLLKQKLLFKALMSMKFLLSREWSKISVYTLIKEIFINNQGIFDEDKQKEINDFMTKLQEMRSKDITQTTQNQQRESAIIQNATNSRNDVRKMNMSGTQGGGDGLNSWANRQMGI